MESSARSLSPTRHLLSRSPSPSRSSSPFGLSIRRQASPTRTGLWSSLDGSSASSASASSFSSLFGQRSTTPSSRVGSPGTGKPVRSATKKKTCMCSPTNHPGSFRCNYHRNINNNSHSQGAHSVSAALNMRRSAMVNSIVRIGSVEGNEMIRKALSTLIRPSSHHMRRRAAYNPRPSRLSHMTRAQDLS